MARKINALIVIILLVLVGGFVYYSQTHNIRPFQYGLDIAGGTQLTYKADTSKLADSEIGDSMASLRDTIDRRVNIFGVTEPTIQTETTSVINGSIEHRLVVELPGVTDINAAIEMIGQTPVLDFRLLSKSQENLLSSASTTSADLINAFQPTGLTGSYLQRAQLDLNGQQQGLGAQSAVLVQFNSDGSKLFSQITRDHKGEILGIFLDGLPISTPVIQEEIPNGSARISGNFSLKEAQTLVRNLNYGALPVPITLIGSQQIGPTLGQATLVYGVKAAIIGLIIIALFLMFWYRLPGFIAIVALLGYVAIMLVLFKLIPVTLSAAGIAGFILSIGMAVDANILIFERTKEERRDGKGFEDAIREGFSRAWPSIRDSNISSLITAVILFWFGTSLVKGFALTFGVGVLVSMFSAVFVSRILLLGIVPKKEKPLASFLFGNGILGFKKSNTEE